MSLLNSSIPRRCLSIVHVSQEIHRGFQLTRGRFGGLFLKVKDAVSAKVSMEELRDFLRNYFPHMRASLDDCKNMLDVFLAMRRECSLANFALLEIVVAHFDVADAREHIDGYKREFLIYEVALLSTDFASEMREEAQFRGSLSRSETIHLKMVWGKDETTLQEFEELIHYVFAPLERYVHLQAVLEGCIHCVCYAHRALMGALAGRAREASAGSGLREWGVIWLVVGEVTVLDLRDGKHGEVGDALWESHTPSVLVTEKKRSRTERSMRCISATATISSARCFSSSAPFSVSSLATTNSPVKSHLVS